MSRQRPWFGMRLRLWLAAALPALLVVGLLVLGFLDRYQNDLLSALRDRARASAGQLAGAVAFPLFADDRDGLQRILDITLSADPQLRGVGVYDPKGQLLVQAGRMPPSWNLAAGSAVLQPERELAMTSPVQQFVPQEPDLFDLGLFPVLQPDATRMAGHVVVVLALDALVQQRRALLWWALTLSVVGLALAGLISTLIATSVTRPIEHISRVVARIRRGQFDARAEEARSGVLATLATGINAMAAQVAMTQEHMQEIIDTATHELHQQKEAAERTARTDALTGVANRRSFSEVAENELRRALRYGQPLSLVMADIDHFKAVNDTYGHQAGDAMLVSVVRALQSEVREVDLVGRWGGEEFVVLLPNSSAQEAFHVAERMRQAVAATELPFNAETLRCTVSLGVAELGAEETSLASLESRADAALYRAKRQGRNRVELADPSTAHPLTAPP